MTDPTPNTSYAHGPGGLFSSPALEGNRRRSKSAQRRAEKAQATFGGVKRADLPDSAFIDFERRSFPVKTAQDVRDAVSSWGRYQGTLSFEEFKRRLTARARAIGAADALPEAWKTAQKAVQIDPDAHPGVMLALMLTPEQQARVVEGIPGRLAQEADHCTLLYVADDAATVTGCKAALLASLASLATALEPIDATLNGYGAFAGNAEQYPLVLLLNSPQLPFLRMALHQCVTGIGIPLEDRYGFTPHITLAYLPADRPMPKLERKNLPLRFDSISLVWAGERIDIPLLGGERTQKADDAYTPPEAARNNARRGLELRREWGRGGTAVGVARARDLANGKSLPYRTVARMAAFNRHRKFALDGRKMPDGGPSAAYIAWLLWGGTSGVDWARGITGSLKASAATVKAPCACSEGEDTATGGERLKTAPIEPQGIATKPFASRAQQRWAFATDQDFAERWADETGDTAAFRRLPDRVTRKSRSAQRRLGLLDPAELDRAEKAGERIAGQLCRSATGKFVNCNSSQATQESKDKLRAQANEQKKQQTAAERAAQEKANIDATFEASSLNEDAYYSLMDFAKGTGEIEGEQELLDAGLVEQNRDGSYRLTPTGRSFVAAARRGDAGRARDALALGTERTTSRRERETARDQRRREIEERRAAREAKRAAAAKPKKGGGGGGGGKKDEKPRQQASTARLRGLNRSSGVQGNRISGASGGGSGARPKPTNTPKPAAEPARPKPTSADQQDEQDRDLARDIRRRNEQEDNRKPEERATRKVKRSHSYWKTYRKARGDGLMPVEARKVAREQVLQQKANRASRERNRYASALAGLR